MCFPQGHAVRAPGAEGGVERIRFTVRGDGSFQVDEPESLKGLEGLPAANRLGSVEEVAAAISQAIDRRFSGLRGEGARLRAFGLQVEADAARQQVVAKLDLERLGVVVLERDPVGLVARHVVCEDGSTLELGDIPIDLDAFGDRMDLAIFLAGEVERLAPERLQENVASGHLAVPEDDDNELFSELPDGLGDIVSGLSPPQEGETWVMDVIVESDDGEEVRYRGVGFTGQAFGAPRVLPKIAFDEAYIAWGQTHRMLVQVTRVSKEIVGYVRLDAERRPASIERKVALVGFLANFTQEPSLG